MRHLVLVATSWGPRHGGINAFNYDLGCALGQLLREVRTALQVVCLVAEASESDEKDASDHSVRLVSMKLPSSASALGEEWKERAAARLREQVAGFTPVHVIGHDSITGELALGLARDISATAALIHHMDYRAYEGIKHNRGQVAEDKHRLQQRLFTAAAHRLAVGPLLRKSLAELLDAELGQVPMLVPGFPAFSPRKNPPQQFSAIVFGRLDALNDRVKQGRLAVAGLGRAIQIDSTLAASKRRLSGAMLYAIGAVGATEDKAQEEDSLSQLATKHAGRRVNVLSLPFTEQRQTLLKQLSEASVALMPSWHEGFGLTGWEAIGLCVPLIVSQQSGVYQLIEETLDKPGLACVEVVDVLGNIPTEDKEEHFADEDLARVAKALLELADDSRRSRQNAQRLRSMLEAELHATWKHTAEQLLDVIEPSWRTQVIAPPLVEFESVFSPMLPLAPTLSPAQAAQAVPDWLEIRPPRWQRGGSPARLLHSEEQVVPFHSPRLPLVERVCTWARDARSGPVAVQLYIGPGGSGKSRLLIEVCRRLRLDPAWQAGFLRKDEAVNLGKDLSQRLSWQPQTLVVLDYGEHRQKELAALVRAGQELPTSHRLRIVLLARAAGDWWNNLTSEEPALAALHDSRFAETLSGPYTLPDLQLRGHERQTAYIEARHAFAERLAMPCPDDDPQLDEDVFAAPLAIHLRALLSVLQDASAASATVEGLLDALLRHERNYWQAALRPGTPIDAVQQAVALLTLLDGVREADSLRTVLKRVPLLREAPHAERETMRKQLGSLYPLQGGADGLRPDLLGEFLVDRALASDDALLGVVCDRPAPPAWSSNALTVLTRMARRWPQKQHWLKRALARHLPTIALVAKRVALETGEPLGAELTQALREARPPIQREVVAALNAPDVLPFKTEALGELAAEVTRRHLEELEKAGEPIHQQHIRLRALAESSLARRLNNLGHFREAVAYQQKAQPRWELLAAIGSSKDREAKLQELVNMSAYLMRLGDHEQAYRVNISALEQMKHEKYQVSLPDQGSILFNNLAFILIALGKPEEALPYAEETLRLYRNASLVNPDSPSSMDDLSLGLGSVALCLSHLARYQEALPYAEEALQIRRHLAATNPDAHRAALLLKLTNCACLHLLCSNPEVAQRLLEPELPLLESLKRRLSVNGPDIVFFLTHLATARLECGEPRLAQEAIMHAEEIVKAMTQPLQYLNRKEAWLWFLTAKARVCAATSPPAAATVMEALTAFESEAQRIPLSNLYRGLVQQLVGIAPQPIVAREYPSLTALGLLPSHTASRPL